jgi:hypothetical protein
MRIAVDVEYVNEIQVEMRLLSKQFSVKLRSLAI